MIDDVHAAFEKHNDEYLKFDNITNKLHPRPDICAFLLLDKLLPHAGRNIVRVAEHDEFYLDVNMEKFAEVASDDDILTLTRCGVRYDSEIDSLSMFA